MFNQIISAAVLSLAAFNVVSAQTYTDCNPLKKTCPADLAFGKEKVSCDFTKGKCSIFKEASGTEIKYDSKGAQFSIEKETNAPTVATKKYLFFGRVDVVVQAAAGQGIVTSIVLQSDDLDEIDWEWVGGDSQQVQTNYFSKGDTSTYDRGAYHAVSDPLTTYHKYSIEWTKSAVNWLIDDNVVRTLKSDGSKGFPETPMQLKLGTWCAGGKDTAKGTVDWAGGYTDFSKAPFIGYYKSVSLVDYAGGDSATDKSVKEYVYGDKSGSWKSIQVKTGDSSDSSDDSTTESKTETTASPTKSQAASQVTKPVVTSGAASGSNSTVTPIRSATATNTGFVQVSTSSVATSAATRIAQGGFAVAAMVLVLIV